MIMTATAHWDAAAQQLDGEAGSAEGSDVQLEDFDLLLDKSDITIVYHCQWFIKHLFVHIRLFAYTYSICVSFIYDLCIYSFLFSFIHPLTRDVDIIRRWSGEGVKGLNQPQPFKSPKTGHWVDKSLYAIWLVSG